MSAQELQALSAQAKTALEAVTAQDPKHLKALQSYFDELEKRYRAAVEELEGDDGEEDEQEDPENPDADIIFQTRDWHTGGLTTTFRDAPSAEEGEIAEVQAYPIFYPKGLQPMKNLKWTLKPSSRPSKPGKLVLDYGVELEELKKEPLFRGFKVLVHMAESEYDEEEEEDEDDAEE
ncbi:hypothetical protein WJX74_006640 [Apatococcus lobatus]|uniref:Uncharacterized protein n=1 Tax=Apatococcus lobatus TaxID=904363 RepID=A0AAW1R0M9_9CHLO